MHSIFPGHPGKQTQKSMLSCFTAQRIMLSSVIFFIHSSSFLLILTVWFWGGRRKWNGLYHQSLDRCVTPYDWGRDEMNELSHKVQGEWRVLLFEFLCFPATARPLHQDCTYHLYFSRKQPEHTAVCYKYFDRGSRDRVVIFWKGLCEQPDCVNLLLWWKVLAVTSPRKIQLTTTWRIFWTESKMMEDDYTQI